MRIEDQIVSLDLALKLKQLGIKQESVFAYWTRNSNKLSLLRGEYKDYGIQALDGEGFTIYVPDHNYVSAFTVAELGELLPDEFTRGERYSRKEKTKLPDIYFLQIDKGTAEFEDYNWYVRYVNAEDDQLAAAFSPSEADARAKLLILLKENNL